MGIGTSLGAYFENDFTHQAGIEDHSHDKSSRETNDNIDVNPDAPNPGYFSPNTERFTLDNNIVTPHQAYQNKQLEKVDNDELGGIEVSKKDKMPFPDNRNPDMDFNSRFGNLPPSGILNDLKPQDTTPPLVRRINDKPGEYIGELGKDDDVSFDRTLPIGRRGDDGKVQYHIDPKDVPLQPGEESFTLPDNPHLWIRKSKESIPMSSNPSLIQEAGLKGTALSDSLIKEFEAFRKMGKPYRDQRDGAIATPEPPPPDNVTMIHPISDVHNINPMNDTENGIIPMLGAPERVSRAAIKYEDKVYEGQHHGDALDQMLNHHATLDFKNMNEGFTTTHGRFVSREEAFNIAKKQDQITSKETAALPNNSTMLLTEDMQ